MLAFQIILSQISETGVMFGVIGALSVALYILKYKKDVYKILFASTSAMFVTFTLKYIFKVPRPEHMLIVETDPRFPSGHATMAAVVATFIIYYSNKHVKNKNLRYLLYLLGIAWLTLVSYSRLYLNVHYPIDVIVGGCIGVTVTIAVLKIFKHFHYHTS